MTTAISRVSLYRAAQPASAVAWGYLPRSKAMPASFILPTAVCGLSFAAGGIPAVTDLGFILLTALCIGWLIEEVVNFQRRFGVGGLLLFGGILLWFCDDYMGYWLGADYSLMPHDPDVVAKAAFYHCIFILFMAIGLELKRGHWAVRLLQGVPEPNSRDFYFILVLFLCFVGFIPYLFFSTENFFTTIWQIIVSGRGNRGFTLTVGRTGALNYNWSGYVLEFIKIGRIAAVLAVIYAVLVAETPFKKIVGWSIWSIWLLLAFGGGNRGHVAIIGVPALFLIFLKYHATAASQGRKISLKAYVGTAVIAVVALYMVQIQAEYRNQGYQDVSVLETDIVNLRGNKMFSEGLRGWDLVGDESPFISNSWTGEGLIKAIPETVFYLVIHPIPRALWRNKPVDPLWAWYNNVMTDRGSANTTVSKGLVGSWYFRYGLLGMLQGAVLVGWMIGVAERALQQAQGRVMVILASLTFLTWLFRCFRDFAIPEFWEFAIALLFVYAMVRIYNAMFPRSVGLARAA